jgi:GH24 family phage-related lysozyme (muramidase)
VLILGISILANSYYPAPPENSSLGLATKLIEYTETAPSIWFQNMMKQLEGCRLSAYSPDENKKKNKKNYAIGYGHTTTYEPEDIDEEEAEKLFIQDLTIAFNKCKKYYNMYSHSKNCNINDFNLLSRGIKSIMVDIAFNLGDIRSSTEFLKAICKNDFSKAVYEAGNYSYPICDRASFRRAYLYRNYNLTDYDVEDLLGGVKISCPGGNNQDPIDDLYDGLYADPESTETPTCS